MTRSAETDRDGPRCIGMPRPGDPPGLPGGGGQGGDQAVGGPRPGGPRRPTGRARPPGRSRPTGSAPRRCSGTGSCVPSESIRADRHQRGQRQRRDRGRGARRTSAATADARRRGARLPARAGPRRLDRRDRPPAADGEGARRAWRRPWPAVSADEPSVPRGLAGDPDDRHAAQGRLAPRGRSAAGRSRLLGMAKGAAMIGPRMATMLAFLLTDARVAAGRPPGDPLRGRRGVVQLHLGRGAHQHQRHRAAPRQRRGRRRPARGATTSTAFAAMVRDVVRRRWPG